MTGLYKLDKYGCEANEFVTTAGWKIAPSSCSQSLVPNNCAVFLYSGIFESVFSLFSGEKKEVKMVPYHFTLSL